MLVRCECCQLKRVTNTFPTTPCICGQTEWIRVDPNTFWDELDTPEVAQHEILHRIIKPMIYREINHGA